MPMSFSAPQRAPLAAPGRVAAFIRLGRPKFLLYSLLVVTLGATAAAHEGQSLKLGWYGLGLLFVWCAHLMTHYCNEYFDLPADQANTSPTGWTGGSRVLVEGLLSPVVSLSAAFVLLFASLLLASLMPTEAARLMALGTVALAWFYTAPPLQLNYRGLGELTVAAVLNCLSPALACHLQLGAVPALLPRILLPTFLIQQTRMMIMNLCDYDGDLRIGKRTLAVVLGRSGTVQAFAAGQLAAYGLVVLFTLTGSMPAPVGAALLFTLPISVWQTRRLLRGALLDPEQRGSVVFWASTHVGLTIGAALLGLLVATAAAPVLRERVTPLSIALPAAVVGVFSAVVARQIRRSRRARILA